jgi:hypothetical protein
MKQLLKYSLLFVLVFFCSCNSGTSNKSEVSKESTVAKLPSLDVKTYSNLLQKCDFIDYIFHQLPISMSQDERSSIVSNLKFISNQPVVNMNNTCSSMARIMYSINGEIVTEAEMYFGDGCTYFVFVKNEKPYAANLMTQDGAVFYNNILNQIKTSNPNAQGSSN